LEGAQNQLKTNNTVRKDHSRRTNIINTNKRLQFLHWIKKNSNRKDMCNINNKNTTTNIKTEEIREERL